MLRARELLEQIDAGDGVLMLTDIFGATPGNVVSRLLEDGRSKGVSGVSLPMLLRVLTCRNGSTRRRRCSARCPAAPKAWCT